MKIEEKYGGYDNIYHITLEDGSKGLIYIPENVNPNTGVHVYARGSGTSEADPWGGRADYVSKILSNGNSDSIVVMPLAAYNDVNWEYKAMDMVDYVIDEYDINNQNLSFSGWSGGAFPAIKSAVEYMKRNPDAPPQIIFTLDDVSPNTYNDVNHPTDSREYILNNGGREAIANNKPVMFVLQANTTTGGMKDAASFAYADAGANVFRVRIVSCGGHEGINDRFFTKNLEEYAIGNAELPDENYIYEKPIYNEETGKWEWETVDVNDIKTIDKLHSYIGYDGSLNINITIPNITDAYDGMEFKYETNNIGSQYEYLNNLENSKISYIVNPNDPTSVKLSSDLEYIQNFTDGLISSIKNEQLESISTISSSVACGPLLAAISNYISSYSSSSAQLLDSLNKESEAIMSYGQAMADMDMDLRNDIEEDIEEEQNTEIPTEPTNEQTNDDENTGQNDDSEQIEENETENQESNENTEEDKQEETENVEQKEESDEEKTETEQNTEDQTEIDENQENLEDNTNDKQNESIESNEQSQTTDVPECNKENNSKPSSGRNDSNGNNYIENENLSLQEQVYEQDGYKVIFGMDGENIETMKYQYEYGTLEEAMSNYQYLINEYKNSEFIDKIILNGNNIEIIFKSEFLENMNIEELMEKYFIGRIDY